MRSAWFVVLLGGCNWLYGLEPTRARDAAEVGIDAPPDANPFLDEDLDGVLNDVDNCPGVPNPDQLNVVDPDPPGDACDPDIGGDNEVVLTYFFNDASDATHFAANPSFTYQPGYFDIERTTGLTRLGCNDVPTFVRGQLTVEAGFELLEETAGARFGVDADAQAHTGLVELRPETWLATYNRPPSVCTVGTTCDEEVIPVLPPRIVVQLRSGKGQPKMGDIKAILAGTGVDAKYDSTGTIENSFGVVAVGTRARLHHVIVYSGP